MVTRVVLELDVLVPLAVERIILIQNRIYSFSPTNYRLSSQEVLSSCCTCEAAAPSESSSCSLVVPFEDLGTVLPFHLGDNHHQHSAAFVNRVRCVFEFAFLTCKTTFTRSDHCLPLNQSVSQSVSLFKVFFFIFFYLSALFYL